MPFAEDHDMIQAVAPKRPNQLFNILVLPGRSPKRSASSAQPNIAPSICTLDLGATKHVFWSRFPGSKHDSVRVARP